MNTRRFLAVVALLISGLAAVVLVSCAPVALSSSFTYQGVLTDGGGAPVSDGDYEVVFRLYKASTATEVYVVTRTVTTQNGVFSTVLSPPIEEMHNPLEVDLTVEGEHLPERQRLYGAPYAMSLVPGATIDGYVYQTSSMSATLNIVNAGDGHGLGVLAASSGGDGGSAILAVNKDASDTWATIRASNVANGSLIEAFNGSETDPWDGGDREFFVDYLGNVHIDGSVQSPAADYADLLPVAETVEPGDVLVIGPDGKLIRSDVSYATNVAGVYSTDPGFVGGGVAANADESDPEQLALKASLPDLLTDESLERVPVAMAGAVPCKASAENGAIQPGDLLVSSDTPGHAMRADPLEVDGVEFYSPGTILGKAMESLDQGTGVILVLISLN